MPRSLETLLFAVVLLAGLLSTCSSFYLNTINNGQTTTQQQRTSHAGKYLPSVQQQRRQNSPLFLSSNPSEKPIMCDLQTFLRLVGVAQTGGMAKLIVQSGDCLLNGKVETRRAKKLYAGDVVQVVAGGGADDTSWDVIEHVKAKGYVFKPKVKKIKPKPTVGADGSLEFGGRYRSEDWRKERKQKKADRKSQNSSDTTNNEGD
jgi:ribosome-associated protein